MTCHLPLATMSRHLCDANRTIVISGSNRWGGGTMLRVVGVLVLFLVS
jgi:hypothetical protein